MTNWLLSPLGSHLFAHSSLNPYSLFTHSLPSSSGRNRSRSRNKTGISTETETWIKYKNKHHLVNKYRLVNKHRTVDIDIDIDIDIDTNTNIEFLLLLLLLLLLNFFSLFIYFFPYFPLSPLSLVFSSFHISFFFCFLFLSFHTLTTQYAFGYHHLCNHLCKHPCKQLNTYVITISWFSWFSSPVSSLANGDG
jgi:hypothetical protein